MKSNQKVLASPFLKILILASAMIYCESSLECTEKSKICKFPNDSSLRFFILGDFGGQDAEPFTTEIQRETAQQVDKDSETLRPHFFLTTGDNFYDRGVKNVSDPRFEETFEKVYKYGKEDNIPWYMTAGNHDHYGNIQAQVQYSELNPRWIFPSQYYSARYAFTGQDSDVRAEFFMLDTTLLCGDSRIKAHLRGPANITAARNSLRWLEQGLRRSKADYLFVVGHYSMYSAGRHDGERCLADGLSNMLMRYHVTAYIAGHNHHLQHITMMDSTGWTTHLVTSGAAAKMDKKPRSFTVRPTSETLNVSRLFTYLSPNDTEIADKGGYVYAEINEQRAEFKYFRSDGLLLYTFSAGKREVKKTAGGENGRK